MPHGSTAHKRYGSLVADVCSSVHSRKGAEQSTTRPSQLVSIRVEHIASERYPLCVKLYSKLGYSSDNLSLHIKNTHNFRTALKIVLELRRNCTRHRQGLYSHSVPLAQGSIPSSSLKACRGLHPFSRDSLPAGCGGTSQTIFGGRIAYFLVSAV